MLNASDFSSVTIGGKPLAGGVCTLRAPEVLNASTYIDVNYAMVEVLMQKDLEMLFAKIDNLVPNTGIDKAVKLYIENGTYFIYFGKDSQKVAEAVFGASLREGVCFTTENLSRKQIVPRITAVL